MGTLFSALDIARSGLQVAQVQLDVAGHNIANVNKEGYSRQRVELSTRLPAQYQFGQLGRGVQIDGIRRMRDTFLDAAYRRVAPGLSSAESQAHNYALIEDIFLEPSENGFGTQINGFFDTLSSLSNNVQSLPLRQSVVSSAQTIAGNLNSVHERLYQQQTGINDEVLGAVPDINTTTAQIAELNRMIRNAEVNGSQASDLRDERDVLLDKLSGFFDIKAIEQSNGSVDVLVGGDSLVDSTGARKLVAVRNPALVPGRNDLYEIRYADTNERVNVSSGSIGAAYTMRDSVIPGVSSQVDQIAQAMIFEVNKIQSQGRGLQNLSGTIAASNAVSDPTAMLDSAGLPFPITAGLFDVVVYDASNTPTTTTINIDPATMSLNDVAAALNGIPNFSASISGNKLQLGANAGFTFRFANDTSDALASLGVNSFFTGTDADSIDVNADIANNVSLLSTGYGLDISNTGDSSAALDMAAVRNALVFNGNTGTISDFYQALIGQIGTEGNANNQNLIIEQAFVNDFDRRRQEVSGVSIDEEVTQLMQYQRAFEGAARIVTVADSMLATLLSMAL